jgi:hypothetical protein
MIGEFEVASQDMRIRSRFVASSTDAHHSHAEYELVLMHVRRV